MGIQDQRCSEARVAGSSERWGPAICPRSSGSFSRDRTRWVPAARPRSAPGTELTKPQRRRGGTQRGTHPLRRENTAGREKDLSGQGALRGVQPRSRAWHLPGAEAHGAAPGPRPQGPRDGVRGEGAQRFPLGVCTFNFKLLFIFLFLFKRGPVAGSYHLAKAKPRVSSCPPGRFSPA